MDPINNPFSPGAGAQPPELVGRDEILEKSDILFGRIKQGRPEKSMLLTGLRGVGKTVLLNTLERHAVEKEYRTVIIEVPEDKSLAATLASPLRSLLFSLDRISNAGDKAKRAIGVLKGFLSGLKVSYGEISLEYKPEQGTADSGDIESDLPSLFVVLGEAAQDNGTVIALFIDEIQYLDEKELSALIMAMHKMQQKQLPLVIIGAGLPILTGLTGESKSYAERLFDFPNIGPLSKEDSKKALQDPARKQNVEFEESALTEIFKLTQGYPYFIQEWGSKSWNEATKSPITLRDVQSATIKTLHSLDESFFRVRFNRLTPGEKTFLRAMAKLGSGPYKMGDLAEELGKKNTNQLSPARSSLMKKGMIYSPEYSFIEFTVPLFDEFMRRTMPEAK